MKQTKKQRKYCGTNNFRKEKIKDSGITLVALVITIIILLILAGISLGELTGNGLLSSAKDTLGSLNKAIEEEEEAKNELNKFGKNKVAEIERKGENGGDEDEEDYEWTIRHTTKFIVPKTAWYYIDAYGAKGGDWAGTIDSWMSETSEKSTATGGKGGLVTAKLYLKEGDVLSIENGEYGGQALTSDQEPGGAGGATSGGGWVFYPDESYGELQPLNGGDGGILVNVSQDDEHTGDGYGENETEYTDDGWHNVGAGGGGYYGGISGERYRCWANKNTMFLTSYKGYNHGSRGKTGTINIPIWGYVGKVDHEDGISHDNWENYGHWNNITWYYAYEKIYLDNHEWEFNYLSRDITAGNAGSHPYIGLKDSRALGRTEVYKTTVDWPIDYDESDNWYHFGEDLFGNFDYSPVVDISSGTTTRISNASYGGTSYYNDGYTTNGQDVTFYAKGGVNGNDYSYVKITNADQIPRELEVASRSDNARTETTTKTSDNKVSLSVLNLATTKIQNLGTTVSSDNNTETTSITLKKKYVDEDKNVILKENDGIDYSPLMFTKNVSVKDMMPTESLEKESGNISTIYHGVNRIDGYTFKEITIDHNQVKEFHTTGYTDVNDIYHEYSEDEEVLFVYAKK